MNVVLLWTTTIWPMLLHFFFPWFPSFCLFSITFVPFDCWLLAVGFLLFVYFHGFDPTLRIIVFDGVWHWSMDCCAVRGIAFDCAVRGIAFETVVGIISYVVW